MIDAGVNGGGHVRTQANAVAAKASARFSDTPRRAILLACGLGFSLPNHAPIQNIEPAAVMAHTHPSALTAAPPRRCRETR